MCVGRWQWFGVRKAVCVLLRTWQRLREQATLIVTVLLTLMVGVLSLKMFDMNGAFVYTMGARTQFFICGSAQSFGCAATIAELRAANVQPVRARPDYVGKAQAFVGGYSSYGHVLTSSGMERPSRASTPRHSLS